MNVSIENIEPQAVMGVRVIAKSTEVGEASNGATPELLKYAGESATGPLLCRYHRWEGDVGEGVCCTSEQPASTGRSCRGQ